MRIALPLHVLLLRALEVIVLAGVTHLKHSESRQLLQIATYLRSLDVRLLATGELQLHDLSTELLDLTLEEGFVLVVFLLDALDEELLLVDDLLQGCFSLLGGTCLLTLSDGSLPPSRWLVSLRKTRVVL